MPAGGPVSALRAHGGKPPGAARSQPGYPAGHTARTGRPPLLARRSRTLPGACGVEGAQGLDRLGPGEFMALPVGSAWVARPSRCLAQFASASGPPGSMVTDVASGVDLAGFLPVAADGGVVQPGIVGRHLAAGMVEQDPHHLLGHVPVGWVTYECRRECMDSPVGSPARLRKVRKERSSVRRAMHPPRSPGHRFSDRSAVGKRARPAGESQKSSRPITQSNSGLVSTVRRRGPDPLVPFAYRTSTHAKFLYTVHQIIGSVKEFLQLLPSEWAATRRHSIVYGMLRDIPLKADLRRHVTEGSLAEPDPAAPGVRQVGAELADRAAVGPQRAYGDRPITGSQDCHVLIDIVRLPGPRVLVREILEPCHRPARIPDDGRCQPPRHHLRGHLPAAARHHRRTGHRSVPAERTREQPAHP